MGCCHSVSKDGPLTKYCLYMRECIYKGDFKIIEDFDKDELSQNYINEPILTLKGIRLNALGYSL